MPVGRIVVVTGIGEFWFVHGTVIVVEIIMVVTGIATWVVIGGAIAVVAGRLAPAVETGVV